MDRILIEGGHRLNGTIPISGAKNSAIKLMAASLLTDEPLVLTGMPRLADTRFMGQLLARLGVEVREENGAILHLHAKTLTDTFAPYDLVRKMRATFNVLGPLLAREHTAKVSLPGGCAIGARPVDLHLKALEAMGAQITLEEGYVIAKAPGGLKGGEVTFPFVSVGATEHALLAAVLAKGTTRLENVAREPEIGDLVDCLNAMGAKISGKDTSTLTIEGVPRLSGTTHRVVADRIEAGTFACAVCATGGDVVLKNAKAEHMGALLALLRKAGAVVESLPEGVRIARNGKPCQSQDMETQPYPGFPTDVQAQFMALMTTAQGTSIIRETIFENRFMHAPELARMGADITVKGNEAVVRGVKGLIAAPVMATDLRASVSLVIAGLVATGTTVVNRVYHLDRGFEQLENKLSACGASIWRDSNSA